MSKNTTTTKKAKSKKTAEAKKSMSSNVVLTALQSLSTKIEKSVITAYKAVNDSILKEYIPMYIQFCKDIVIPRFKNLVFLEFGSMKQDDFVNEINALSGHALRNYATAILLSIRFSICFDKVSSTALQALFYEISKVQIGLLPKFSGTMFHFGMHGNCKYKTGETTTNKEGKLQDKVAIALFDVYPFAMKSSKIMTKIESGYYYPIPELASLYCTIANSLSQQQIEYIFERFCIKCLNDKEKGILKFTK